MLKSHTALLTVSILLLLPLYATAAPDTSADYDLAQTQPSWVAVLGGSALCCPVPTSYGFAVVGEGKMVSAFTNSGTVIWQRSFAKPLKPYISVGLSDMLYVISGSTTLAMLNPGGTVIWTVDTGFSVQSPPVAGRDGRVFVKGDNCFACYGLNGIRRWKIDTDSQDDKLPPVELDDGSLLVFLTRTENGKSIATRVSPFGNVLEQIVFAGRVKEAVSCSGGVLLVFKDGSTGFCSVKENVLVSNWVLLSGTGEISSATKAGASPFPHDTAVVISGSPAHVLFIATSTGKITSSIPLNSLDTSSVMLSCFSSDGFIAADKRNAFCVKSDGTVVWQASFNARKKWNYLFSCKGGYISFCESNWVIESFRMKQSVESGEMFPYEKKRVQPYSSFYNDTDAVSSELTGRALSNDECVEIKNAYIRGDFGQKEADWLPVLEDELDSLCETWNSGRISRTAEKSYYDDNPAYVDMLLTIAGLSGTALFQQNVTSLLNTVTDPSLLQMLVDTAGRLSFDSDEQMLFSLENAIRHISPKNEPLLTSICDAVYAICKYMGRPAFLESGKSILSSLMYPQYDAKVRDNARATLERISALKL